MNFEELKHLFQCQKFESTAKLSPSAQMELMRKRMKSMHRLAPWVEVMEIVVGVGTILFVAWLSLFHLKIVPLVSRIGFLILIVSFGLFDIWKPIRARRMPPEPPADAPVTQYLRYVLEKLRVRAELKRSELLQELLLFWLGAILLAWGLDTGLLSRIFLAAFVMGTGVIICVIHWKVKQFKRRITDQPLIEELESLLKSNNPTEP